MQNVLSIDELRDVVDNELDFRFDCGYLKGTHQIELSDKEALIKAVWLHHVFFLPHAELDQLQKGLRETLQMEIFAHSHPQELHCCLLASCAFDITPDFLLDSFAVRYSFHGSNDRTAEEAIILHWTEYITECAGEKYLNVINYCCLSHNREFTGFTE